VRKIVFAIVMTAVMLVVGWTMGKGSQAPVYTGSVEADQIDVSSETSGVIVRIYAEEGRKAKEGDLLVKIDTKSLELQLQQAEAGLELAKANLDDVENGIRDEEIKRARANVENISALVEGARKNYEYRLETYEDMKKLFENSGISQKELEEARTQVDTAYANLLSLQKQYDAAGAQLDLLLNGPTGQKVKMAQAEVDRARAQVELLKYQISRGQVTAPCEGIVQNIYYKEGELIPVGGNILTLTDFSRLWVKIYVPSKELYRFSLGQQLNLSADFDRGKKFKGRIVYISPEAEFTPKNVESKENKQEMVFAIKVEIVDHEGLLKPGMLVDVVPEGEDHE
jgi:HlyD family secretion protein